MSRIRDIAKVTLREARGTERIEDKAWLVWRSLRTGVEQSKAPQVERFGTFEVRNGVDGYRIKVSLNQVILALWPEWAMLDKKELSDVTQPVYAYLKTSGNAVCVQNPGRNAGTTPTWWIRDEWFGGQAIVVPQTHHPREADRARREAKVTPTEAGEDREPAPVTVLHPPAPEPDEDAGGFQNVEHRRKFEQAREEARQRRMEKYRTALLDALIKADDWMSTRDLKDATGFDQFALKRNVDALVADGLVEKGRMTKAGTLYRAAGVEDKPAEKSDDGPDITSVTGTNRAPGSSIEPSPAGDVVEPAPDSPGVGTSMLADRIGSAVSSAVVSALAGLDVDRITRERDDAVLRADLLAKENRDLKAKIKRFKKLLED